MNTTSNIFLEDLVSDDRDFYLKDKNFKRRFTSKDNSIYKSEITFENCTFEGEIDWYMGVFEKRVLFRNCTFYFFRLVSPNFKGRLEFRSCIFNEEMKMIDPIFQSTVLFELNSFKKGFNFFSTRDKISGHFDARSGMTIV